MVSVPELVPVLESHMCSFACIFLLILLLLSDFWKLATSCVEFSCVFFLLKLHSGWNGVGPKDHSARLESCLLLIPSRLQKSSDKGLLPGHNYF